MLCILLVVSTDGSSLFLSPTGLGNTFTWEGVTTELALVDDFTDFA